jgi:competence protein ComEC
MDNSSIQATVKIPFAGPAMKAAVAFAAGIVTSAFFQATAPVILLLAVAGLVTLMITYRHDRMGNLAALSVLFLTGMLAFTIHSELNKPLEISDSATYQTVRVEGVVTGSTKFSFGNTRFTLQCKSLVTDTGISEVSGLLPCILYSRKIPIPEGSSISMQGKIKRYSRPFRPYRIRSISSKTNFKYRLVVDATAPDPIIFKRGKSFFGNIQDSISNAINRYPFGGYGNLLKAMVIGDTRELSPATRGRFAQSGIAHVLAVSGLHVGILAIVLNFILSIFSISRKFRSLIIVFIIFCYAGICGFRPPVIRAFIMISMVFSARIIERTKNVENSIFVALIAILVIYPPSLFGPSIQLSFAAVWGITTFYSPILSIIKKRFRLTRGIEYFVGLFVISGIATATTAPIVAAHFKYIPLYGIAANLLAVPMTFAIVSSGMASIFLIFLGATAAPLATLSSFITGTLLAILSLLTEFVSSLPYASIFTGKVSPLVGITLIAWLYIISRARGRNTFKKAAFYIPLALLLVLTWHPLLYTGSFGGRQGSVVFFDVGQGDAALVEYDNSRRFLIDTGPVYGNYDTGNSIIVPSLKSAGITHLDGIFLSHTDHDHSGGLGSILKHIRTDNIFCRRSIADSLRKLFDVRVTGVSAGDSIAFSEGGILILSPPVDEQTFHSKNIIGENNASLLVRFNISGVRLLFTGDIEKVVQRLAVSWDSALESEILKVPHHGASGLQNEFIAAIQPELAVISCGFRNMYGHPAATTISTLNKHGCTVQRTDTDGTIRILLPSMKITP